MFSVRLVGWSLTSLVSTNTAISETNVQRTLFSRVRLASFPLFAEKTTL